MASICIINPTSTVHLDHGIDEAVRPLKVAGGPDFRVVHIEDARPAVQSQSDSDLAGTQVVDLVSRLDREGGADAYVIACFSDPGLHAAREATRAAVFGIGESGLLTAMTLGQKIGVISILPNSIPRHWRMFGAMGIEPRIGCDVSVGIGVVELESTPDAMDRMVEKGLWLKDQAQCDVIVLGCAGMAPFEAELTRRIGIPVIDPVRAAAAHALGRVLLKTGAAR
ncbi:MAG: aspartate/glutamate racemase family protein [Aquamicrobium sp.]|uniref:aspartate/glutamate racemase family protein n=1 Tax=Aquamicrobium sp. TaxID=1872579 RepID=UPI00349E7FB9|nr:aspartate/glutamate racemase family protein [Aquamicrobium sp.]